MSKQNYNLPLGRVRKSMWQEYLSIDTLAFSSKWGARIFFALTVTLYTVFAAKPGKNVYIHLISFFLRHTF